MPKERAIRSRGSRKPAWLQKAGRPHVTAAAQPTDVLVLDFDGVLVNSEPEVGPGASLPHTTSTFVLKVSCQLSFAGTKHLGA